MSARRIFVPILLACISLGARAIDVKRVIGWQETAAVEWAPCDGAAAYSVTYSGEGVTAKVVDSELIRMYPDCLRADIPGLKAGIYTLTILAMDSQGKVIDSVTTPSVAVTATVREGFAFRDGFVPGAYNMDGTPKDGAQIIYVTAHNANTVTLDVIGEKGKAVTATGLMNILNARGKGYDKTPLIIRIIGCIKKADISGLTNKGNYIAFTGANTDKRRIENITVEGIGNDATVYGYGFFTKRSRGIEIRNFGIMLFGDDGVSMEADNSNIWVHNCDFFYGSPGSDKDQVKGDGSIDMKYNTTDVTISHNHFWDSGKSTFAGGASESNPIYFTYHHNWFDHADSRCPRLCHATAHIYNNYFDANATMCLLSTENTSAFVEANYYRNCPSPMEINMQGTNRKRWPDGEQNGGMNKGYDNVYEGPFELVTQHDNATDFDVYVVEERTERIPESVKSIKGGNTYSNFDTEADMYHYTPDAPHDVPEKVMASAGRMEGGDFRWVFDNDIDDSSTAVNTALKEALLKYEGRLIGAGASTGISTVAAAKGKGHRTVYDLNGNLRVKDGDTDSLPHGVYIINDGGHGGKRIVR